MRLRWSVVFIWRSNTPVLLHTHKNPLRKSFASPNLKWTPQRYYVHRFDVKHDVKIIDTCTDVSNGRLKRKLRSVKQTGRESPRKRAPHVRTPSTYPPRWEGPNSTCCGRVSDSFYSLTILPSFLPPTRTNPEVAISYKVVVVSIESDGNVVITALL